MHCCKLKCGGYHFFADFSSTLKYIVFLQQLAEISAQIFRLGGKNEQRSLHMKEWI